MKRMFLLLASGLLASTVALAQDMPSSTSDNGTQDQNTKTSSRTYNSDSSVVRGCLSGSAGNYTLTDQNGMQYTVMGDDTALQGKAGHEVEITTRQDQASETHNQGDNTTSRTTNSIQVSNVRDIAGSCTTSSPMSAPPATEQNGTAPNAAPDAAEPPRPQMMAMLQQQSKPDEGTNGNMSQQATPPVTSQTPATSTAPTSNTPAAAETAPNSQTTTSTSTTTTTQQQTNTSPANNSGMTESEANHDAQAARQGELNTNPQTGDTTGRGVNNQGVNNPSTTNPNAVPSSPNSATPSSNTQQPQANSNDQNKPLYERQATDIPWANQSGGNTGTPNPPH